MQAIRHSHALLLLISVFLYTGNVIAVEFETSIEEVRVTGLAPDQLARIAALDSVELAALLAVTIQQDGEVALDENATTVMGRSKVEAGDLVFRPRFAFDKGLSYFVALSLRPVDDPLTLEANFSFEQEPRFPSAQITQIYPSDNRLPENLFKFYIHFNQPMSRGQAYQRIHLLDQERRRVELPFLELGEELWNPEGTRFTLLFDPGRIKQDLVPNLEAGLPLVEGQQFTLLIESAWLDANGVPMVEDFQKQFQVVARDTTQPEINSWQLGSPTEGTREPLWVRFDEPLDHGLLQNTIHVESQTGTQLMGSISISANEMEWRFTPASNWQAENYELVVEGILEDRSANSLGRAFEVFVSGEQGPEIINNYRLALSIVPE